MAESQIGDSQGRWGGRTAYRRRDKPCGQFFQLGSAVRWTLRCKTHRLQFRPSTEERLTVIS